MFILMGTWIFMLWFCAREGCFANNNQQSTIRRCMFYPLRIWCVHAREKRRANPWSRSRCVWLSFHLRSPLLWNLDFFEYIYIAFFLCVCVLLLLLAALLCVSAACLCIIVFSGWLAGCAGARLCSGCAWPGLYWEVRVFHVLRSVLP